MKNVNLFCVVLLIIFSFSAEAKSKKNKKTSRRGPASVQEVEASSPEGQAIIAQKEADRVSGRTSAPMCTNYSPPHPGISRRPPAITPTRCRASRLMTESEMTAEGIVAFINQNRNLNFTLKDTICCIPEEWRSQYVVASTSNSLQASTPDNPRIILSPFQRLGDPAPGKSVAFLLDGSESIEVLDQHNGVARYSDISFTQEQVEGQTRNVPHGSYASGRCTTCHGPTSNPSPLMSFAPIWQNTFPKFYKPTVCPTEGERQALDDERRRIQAALRRPGSVASCLPGFDHTIDVTAEEDICHFYGRTVDTDPTCSRQRGRPVGALVDLSDKADAVRSNIEGFFDNRLGLMTEGFETSVIETSHEALAREIVTWPDYAKYKYSLVGSLLGCFAADAPRSADWFPAGELQRQSAAIDARQTTSFMAISSDAGREWQTILHSNSATPDATLVSNLTCREANPANFQNQCFPDARCNTVPRMIENLQETLTAARAAANRSGVENKVDAEILRTIADSNWEQRRNWLPLGCGHRNIDPDAWAVARYLTSIMPNRPQLRNLWSYIFTSGRNNRIVEILARKLMAIDSDLQRVVPNQAVSPCADLQRASKAALADVPASAPAEPSVTPAATSPSGAAPAATAPQTPEDDSATGDTDSSGE